MQNNSLALLKALLNDFQPSQSTGKSGGGKVPNKTGASDHEDVSTQQSAEEVKAPLVNWYVQHSEAEDCKVYIEEKEKPLYKTNPLLVPHDSDLYKESHYFKCFHKTPRYPVLNKAIKELTTIFNSIDRTDIADSINELYKTYGEDDQAKCVTMIWTSNTYITNVINCAIVVDAVRVHKYDKEKFKYYFDQLEDVELYYKYIISKSMKFIRILNSCIVDMGTFYNDADRVTYRGINKCILQDIEVGQTLRVINWMWTSESLQIAKQFSEEHDDKVIVQCNIKEYCFNAGQINKFGKSFFFVEKETLIPPYTVVTLISREEDYIVLDVAQDNKDHDFDMPNATA